MLHTTIYINKVYSDVTKPTSPLEAIKDLSLKKHFAVFMQYSPKDNCKCYIETTLPKSKYY